MAVDVGLVDGTTAATTPNGSAISMTRRSLVARNHAHGLHGPDELIHVVGRETILLNLVRDDAVAGLLDGEDGERLGVQAGSRRDGVNDRVDLGL